MYVVRIEYVCPWLVSALGTLENLKDNFLIALGFLMELLPLAKQYQRLLMAHITWKFVAPLHVVCAVMFWCTSPDCVELLLMISCARSFIVTILVRRLLCLHRRFSFKK